VASARGCQGPVKHRCIGVMGGVTADPSVRGGFIRLSFYSSFYEPAKLESLFQPGYTPSDDDILRCVSFFTH